MPNDQGAGRLLAVPADSASAGLAESHHGSTQGTLLHFPTSVKPFRDPYVLEFQGLRSVSESPPATARAGLDLYQKLVDLTAQFGPVFGGEPVAPLGTRLTTATLPGQSTSEGRNPYDDLDDAPLTAAYVIATAAATDTQEMMKSLYGELRRRKAPEGFSQARRKAFRVPGRRVQNRAELKELYGAQIIAAYTRRFGVDGSPPPTQPPPAAQR
jgi:hypothetical protein